MAEPEPGWSGWRDHDAQPALSCSMVSTAQPELRAHGLAHAAALSCSEDEGREFGPGLQMRQQGQWGSCLTLLSTESSRSQKEAVALP